MSATHELATTVRRGVVELTRPGEGDLAGPEMARFGRLVLTLVIAATNLIGALDRYSRHAAAAHLAGGGPAADPG